MDDMKSSPETLIPETLIKVTGLSLAMGGADILIDIDLEVRAREIVTLIGPNGAGKTTLVRILLGLLEGGGGTVFRRPGLRIGYLPQHLAADGILPITVAGFLALAGRQYKARIAPVLDVTGAGALARAAMHELSGGELRRVYLARALIARPGLLVLDEPAQAVDINGQAELYRLIGEIRDAEGCGVLMVSHDLHLVMAAADQVVCINRHLCCAGHPEAVGRDPRYVALFGDGVAASLALYQHHHDHRHGVDGVVVAAPSENGHG